MMIYELKIAITDVTARLGLNHAISSFSVNNLRVVVTQQQSQPLQHQALPNGRTGPGGTENDQVKDGPSIIVIGKNVTFTYPILSSSSIIALRMLVPFIPKTVSKAKHAFLCLLCPQFCMSYEMALPIS